MGGNVPLGYDCIDRRLVINKEGAETVRKIFHQYLECGSVGKLKQLLDHGGICSKGRKNSDGTACGGRPFSRGALHHLLRNRIYIGETVHKTCSYRGQHEAIIGNKLWEQVAERLKQNDQARRSGGSSSTPSLLTGKLFDTNDVRFTPTHAVNNGRRSVQRPLDSSPSRTAAQEAAADSRCRGADVYNLVENNLPSTRRGALPGRADGGPAN
jgi:site-specific DNA recombinase